MAGQKYVIPLREMEGSERPRERLLRFGPDALKSHELLAIILNTGYRGESVLDHVILGKGNFVSLKEMGKL